MFSFEYVNDRQLTPKSGVKYFGCKRDGHYSYQWVGWNGKPIPYRVEEKTEETSEAKAHIFPGREEKEYINFVNVVGICVKAEDSDYANDACITEMQVIEFNCRANPASILDIKNPRIVWEIRIDFLGIDDPEETMKAVVPRRFWKAALLALQAAKKHACSMT